LVRSRQYVRAAAIFVLDKITLADAIKRAALHECARRVEEDV